MKKSLQITGLDIGSSKVSVVAAESDGSGSFNIIGHVTSPAKGISRGLVEDLGSATNSVAKALNKLRDKIGKRPSNIYVNLTGDAVRGERAKGMIPLSMRGREVTVLDMERCVSVASTISLPLDREIMHKIVHHFSIDDQPYIKNPLGLSAARLACEVYIVTAPINQIQNIYKCVDGAGYDVRGVAFGGIADSMALLEESEKEEGVVLVNMGNSLTEASIFVKGALAGIDVIPQGAKDFGGNVKESPALNSIAARINVLSQDFVKSIDKKPTVILCGGAAFTEGIVEFLEERLSLTAKVGVAGDVRGYISGADSMRCTTAIGLAKYGYSVIKKRALERKNLVKHTYDKLIDIFNNYF